MHFVLGLLPEAAADVYDSDQRRLASKQTLSPVMDLGATPRSSLWASSVLALAPDHTG